SCPGYTNVTGVLFAPDGSLFAAMSVQNAVVKFDPATGVCAGRFASGGGLSSPIGLALSPTGDLLVGSFFTNSVLRFDAQTGALRGTLVASGSGGLNGTHNFAFFDDRPEDVRVVPVVLDVTTALAHFTTELVLTNRGAAPAVARLRFHRAGGGPGDGELSL